MPDYLLSINNHVLLCYFISKNSVSKSKGDKEMKSKKYGMMLAVLAAAGGVSAVECEPVEWSREGKPNAPRRQ